MTGALSSVCARPWRGSGRRGPLGHADLLDVGGEGFGDGLVEVARPRRAEDAFGDSCRSSRLAPLAIGSRGVEVADALVIPFAEVVPDLGEGRDDVGLIAAVGDDVVGALLGAEVFAADSSSRRS